MAEKKNKPQLRFIGNNEEWQTLKFGKTFTSISKNTLSRAELNYTNGLAKNIHYGDVLIKFGEILDVKKNIIPYISNDVLANKLKSSKLQDGDLIIADTAEDETVGKCTELLNVGAEIILSGLHTIPIRPKLFFATGYLGYFINSFAYHNQLLRLMQGTKVSSISKAAIQDTTINYPIEKDEQSKIGIFFLNLDKLITLHQKKYDKLVQIKKAMLDKMFPKNSAYLPEIHFKGFEGEWEEKKLKHITSYIVDNRGKNPRYYCKEGIPVIDNFMIKNNVYPYLNEATRFIDDSLLNNFIRKYNEVDDLLITLVGNGIGNVTLFPNQKSVIIQNTLGLRFLTDKKFMFYSLISKNKIIKSLDRGMAQPSIRQDELLDINIELPCDIEQIKISNFFYNIDKLINLHQQQLEKLKNIKKSCLEKMFI